MIPFEQLPVGSLQTSTTISPLAYDNGLPVTIKIDSISFIKGLLTEPNDTTWDGAISDIYVGQFPIRVRSSRADVLALITTAAAAAAPFVGYVLIHDVASGNGGTFTLGAWRTRDLNTIVSDTSSLAALSSNQITLQPGVFTCTAQTPAYNVGGHICRLQDVDNATTLGTGHSAFASTTDNGFNSSILFAKFTLTTATVLELQHQAVGTQATNGFGIDTNIQSTEIYSSIEFYKIAEA